MSDTVPPKRRSRWKKWLLALAGLYALFLLVLCLFETALVYRATPASEEWHDPSDFAHQDVHFQTAQGDAIHGWWCPIEKANGALLYCHGQQGNLSFRIPHIRQFQKLHVSVLVFDYPGFGQSPGSPTEQGCYAATDAAYQWLIHQKQIPPEKILILGKSLGSGVAVDLAARMPHRCLILLKPYTSLPEVAQRLIPIAPVKWLMRNRFNSLAKISHCPGPVFIANGSDDWKLPSKHAQRLYAAARDPKLHFEMNGIGHGGVALSEEALTKLKAFLKATRLEGVTNDDGN